MIAPSAKLKGEFAAGQGFAALIERNRLSARDQRRRQRLGLLDFAILRPARATLLKLAQLYVRKADGSPCRAGALNVAVSKFTLSAGF